MTVYVDHPLDWGKGSVKQASRVRYWCHMMADTIEELHEMAARLKMPKAWYQGPPSHAHPHYDLSLSRRKQAVAAGAVDISEWDRQHTLALLKRLR